MELRLYGRICTGGHRRMDNDGRSLYNARLCASLGQKFCRISFTLPVGLGKLR